MIYIAVGLAIAYALLCCVRNVCPSFDRMIDYLFTPLFDLF